MQPTYLGGPKSIAGAALIGLGTFILYENLDGAATQLSLLLGTTPRQTLGVLLTLILAASHVLQAYASNHQRFLQGFFQHMLVSFWPLLLVIAGTVLSRDAFTDHAENRGVPGAQDEDRDNVNSLPKRDPGLADLPAQWRTFEYWR